LKWQYLNHNIFGDDGFVALEKEGILLSYGLDGYYSTEFLGRLSYAKPENWSAAI